VTYVPKDVSVDPGPEAVPATGSSIADRGHGPGQAAVVDGLGARADDPRTAEPLEHPQGLVGERPAKGSVENPG
jgi:hypothetical protein